MWTQVIERVQWIEAQMPRVWPVELPPESAEDFWWHAQRAEMQTRECVDGLLRSLLGGQAPASIPALAGWMIQRRVEWAGQLMLDAMKAQPCPREDAASLLLWLLIESWQSDGQHAFHKHASRDGAAAAINPDAPSRLWKKWHEEK